MVGVRRSRLVGYGLWGVVAVDGLLSRRSPLRAGVSFKPFSSQGQMYHGSHCIHVRYPVVFICGGLPSKQARQEQHGKSKVNESQRRCT